MRCFSDSHDERQREGCCETIEVLHTLRPIVVVMAGADEFDP